ncbi:MAG: hypothetical protein LBV45_02090 [Xanthomonadaceae bacterium]|jgi:hypothetical protein|nr:hypothetical protein [Xanthomonadaceae bacterium]
MSDVLISNLPTQSPESAAAAARFWTGGGSIWGVEPKWTSANSILVSSGSALIPEPGFIVNVDQPISQSGLSLPPSSFRHLYLTPDPNIEISTTEPIHYFGNTWIKGNDNSRRYLGSLLTDENSALIRFRQDNGIVRYIPTPDPQRAPFQVLSAKNTIAETRIDLSHVVPVTAIEATATLHMGNNETDVMMTIGALSGTQWASVISPSGTNQIQIPLVARELFASLNKTPAYGGGNVYITGYRLSR